VAEGRMRGRRLLSLSGEGIAIEAIKRAEDGRGTIVRLYETRGRRAEGRLVGSFRSAVEVDLLEENPRALPLDDHAVALSFAPFEILTIKLEMSE
jgi:alpha-mannosidase